MHVVLALASALCYGVGDFSGGFAAGKGRVLSVLVISQAAGLATAFAALAIMGAATPGVADLAWGMAGGLGGAFGLTMLYRGIASGVVAIVSPSAALVGSVLPVAFGLMLGERPGTPALAGIGLCVPAIVLLSTSTDYADSDGKKARLSLMHGLLAGLGFGLFFVALSRPADNTGSWPLIAARFASISVALVILASRRERVEIARGGRAPAILAGVFDMAANIFFVLASGSGMLSVVAIVVSLYPAPTVLLARLVFRERITPARWAGLALTLVGLALISLG